MPNKRPSDPDPESASEQPAAATPSVRRISNPRPKKGQPKPDPEPTAASDPAPAPSPAAVQMPPQPAPEPQSDDSDDESPSFDSEWPAPETSGAQSQEGGKRKRRRRKNKGGQGGQGGSSQQASADTTPPSDPSGDVPADPSSQQRPQPPSRPQPPQRPKVDPTLLAKRAWKIYLSEVSEEGVALISDQDARELTRRCFRLAEIFLEEQSRRS